MGDLTSNLSVKEFACTCKYPECTVHKSVAHMPLVLAIQDAVDHFKKKYNATQVTVEITGGNRCPKHNAEVDGAAPGSKHCLCIAADHKIKVMVGLNWQTIEPEDLYAYYDKKYFDRYGVGLYSNRVHLDTRATKARWGK